MGSNLIVTTNTWLQKASMSLPYAQLLQDYLWGRKELKLRKISLPAFYIPENLFLKSDGRVRYTLNKQSMKFEIPLPFGGKSSKDLKILQAIRTPALNFKSVGFYLPSQEFQVPAFTIPELYQLQVPLLGMLDVSTNIYSNSYNWSASYSVGNVSTDHLRLKASYHMKADSAVELLSYHMRGELCSVRGCTGLICHRLWWGSLLLGAKDLSFFLATWNPIHSFIYSFIQPIEIFIKHIMCIKCSTRQWQRKQITWQLWFSVRGAMTGYSA